MRPHERGLGDGERVAHGLGAAVGEVDQHAQPIALLYGRLAELGHAGVLGPLRLEVGERIADVVDELHVADAQIVGGLQLRPRILVEKARAFDRKHDVRIALERQIDVGGRAHDLQALLRDVLLDARDVLLEPGLRLAGLRAAALLKAPPRALEPGHVAHERPGEERHVAGRHRAR